MAQSTRFGERLSSLVNVAAFGTRSRQKLSASILLALVAASVSTAAYALRIEIFVNGTSALVMGSDATAGPNDPGPYESTLTIPNNTYCSTAGHCVTTSSGIVTATVLNLSGPISTSGSITTKINVSGNFKYVGVGNAGTMEIVTSNKFALASGVWTTFGKGASKVCKKATNPLCTLSSGSNYVASSTCSFNSSTIQNGGCTFGRTFSATDDGYVTRIVSGVKRPAGGVSVELRSQVAFFNTTGTEVRTENVGGSFPVNPKPATDDPKVSFGPIPLNSTALEAGHFYLGTSIGGSAGEMIPCEPLNTDGNATFTCANTERKINKLTFINLNANDTVELPTTSTDLGASDSAFLGINLNAKALVDVQPIAVVANTDPETQGFHPLLGDPNSDWNPTKLSGKRQVLMMNSYKGDGITLNVNVCEDIPTENVTITVAGSTPAPAESSAQSFVNGSCIGKVFVFDYGAVNSSIPGDKLATCLENPIVTLFASGVPLTSQYDVDATPQGGKPSAYLPPDPVNCTHDNGVTTCTIPTEVDGSQLVRCCTSCG